MPSHFYISCTKYFPDTDLFGLAIFSWWDSCTVNLFNWEFQGKGNLIVYGTIA